MRALVTGGGGFLGRYIVKRLLARGDSARVLGRRAYPDLETLGVEVFTGDLRDPGAVGRACVGMDAVFHVAARAGYWGTYDEYFGPNVGGTRNVLNGCRAAHVPKLIFTSTASVVSAPGNVERADESVPYARKYKCPYPASKAIAERMVLESNRVDGLLTTALRPHFIFGPGDPHFMPRILDRGRCGRLIQVGGGRNKVDVSYVENAAEAHLLAVDRLGGSAIDGKAYFISQGKPIVLWPWVNTILEGVRLPRIRRGISHRAALAIGATLEAVHTALPRLGEPNMTRFLADQLATSHYFDISNARRDLDYEPIISTEEGLEKTLAALEAGWTSSYSDARVP